MEEEKAKVQYDQMSAHVEQMLEFQRKFPEEGDNREKEKLNKAISQLDRRNDRLVNGLYGLTKEEIAILERETIDNKK